MNTLALIRLIYASRVAPGVQEEQLQKILATAWKHNGEHGISGILYFNGDVFFQCLEGMSAEVNQLYHRIVVDPRHRQLTLLEVRTISERQFADWKMGYVPDQVPTRSVLRARLGSDVFDPFALSGETALELLLDLKPFAAMA